MIRALWSTKCCAQLSQQKKSFSPLTSRWGVAAVTSKTTPLTGQ